MMTGAFSQNVGKLFSELKLVTVLCSSQLHEKPLKENLSVQCLQVKSIALPGMYVLELLIYGYTAYCQGIQVTKDIKGSLTSCQCDVHPLTI